MKEKKFKVSIITVIIAVVAALAVTYFVAKQKGLISAEKGNATVENATVSK